MPLSPHAEPEIELADHPAVYSAEVIAAIDVVLAKYLPVPVGEDPPAILDPYAGQGQALEHWDRLGYQCAGMELEPEWACGSPLVVVADALEPPWPNERFDAIVTSPCYGNRMADHHDAQDDSTRITYAHRLGHKPSPGSAAIVQWGQEYRTMHEDHIAALLHCIPPGEAGLVVVNMKNHVRAGNEQLVVEWWLNMLLVRGCRLLEVTRVETPGMGFGQNSDLRAECEFLIVVRPPATRRLL